MNIHRNILIHLKLARAKCGSMPKFAVQLLSNANIHMKHMQNEITNTHVGKGEDNTKHTNIRVLQEKVITTIMCIVGKLHVKISPPFVTRSQHRHKHKQKHKPHCAHWDSLESLETKHRNGNERFFVLGESKMHTKTNMNNSNDATVV